MRKKNYKGRCQKRTLSKSKEVCRFYDAIQSKYADILQKDKDIEEICCNVPLESLPEGEFTSDFLCVKKNGDYMVMECVQRKYLQKPMTVKLLDISRNMLIGSVAQAALNHIGMLVVDEIQNVVNSKNGKSLIGALTQLINNSGISICMVGTPESTVFFESAMQLARRSVGLQYTTMNYDEYFQSFCKVIFKYQFLKNHTEITAAITEWLYEHSAGVVSVVISLIHDAQEIAILTGKEVLNLDTLNEAYQQRLSLLHRYIQPSVIQNNQTTRKKKTAASIKKNQTQSQPKQEIYSISEIAEKAKAENLDVVKLLKNVYKVVEVSV